MELQYQHLLGLEFEHGKRDCYQILIDFMALNYNIHLTPYARPDDWWVHGMNFYMDYFPHEGYELKEIKFNEMLPGDLILAAIPDPRCPVSTPVNHCAIYLGNDRILHHLLGRRSEECRFTGSIVKRYFACIIRHKDIPAVAIPKVQTLDMMDLILPHKRKMLQDALDGLQTTE